MYYYLTTAPDQTIIASKTESELGWKILFKNAKTNVWDSVGSAKYYTDAVAGMKHISERYTVTGEFDIQPSVQATEATWIVANEQYMARMRNA